MTVRAAGLSACVSFALSVVLSTACSLTVGTRPDAYPFPSERVFDVTPGGSVSVSNFYGAEERVELGSRVYCDLRHFTETAISMVQRELGKKGLILSPDGNKTVVLRMTHPSWVQGMWSMKGRVRLEAQLGNGDAVAVDGESQTGGNAMRAFNGAILRAVTALLEDPTLAAYLNEP